MQSWYLLTISHGQPSARNKLVCPLPGKVPIGTAIAIGIVAGETCFQHQLPNPGLLHRDQDLLRCCEVINLPDHKVESTLLKLKQRLKVTVVCKILTHTAASRWHSSSWWSLVCGHLNHAHKGPRLFRPACPCRVAAERPHVPVRSVSALQRIHPPQHAGPFPLQGREKKWMTKYLGQCVRLMKVSQICSSACV